mgnify:CR=1 FL=1
MIHKLLILMTALVLAGCAGKTRTNNTQNTESSATENTAEVEPLTAEQLDKRTDFMINLKKKALKILSLSFLCNNCQLNSYINDKLALMKGRFYEKNYT